MNFFINSPFEHFGLTSLLSNYAYINNLTLLYIIIIYLCFILNICIIDTITYNIIPLNAFDDTHNNIDMILDFGLLVSFPIIWSTLLCYIFYILQYVLFDSILFTENYLLELAIIPDSI